MTALQAQAILDRLGAARGARITQAELAGVLGMSLRTVNRSLARTTSDPISYRLALALALWDANPSTIPPALRPRPLPPRQRRAPP